MRLDGRDPGSRLAPLALGLVAVFAAVLWWMGGDDPEPVPGPGEVAAIAPGDGVTPSTEGPPSEPLAMVRPAVPAGEPIFGEPPPIVAPPPPRIDRKPPPGTPERHALALKKLPHSNQDRAPLGGIGPRGMHVDRITMGTTYDRGACSGPVGKFSLKTEKIAHVCFRVVHPRVTQRVIVHWERDGRLVRRTFVKIGDTHGYRTRAALSLRRRTKGNWKARVMSTDGVELASHAFQIL